MVDLPKLIELKPKNRLILDESISFVTVGRTGRGLTKLYNAPAIQIYTHVGSVANGLNLSGNLCACSRAVVDHQRINVRIRFAKPVNPATPAPHDALSFDIACEERLLQDIALAQGLRTVRVRLLRGQELFEAQPSINLAATAAVSWKE